MGRTVRELSPAELEAYRKAWGEHERAQERALQARAGEMMRAAQEAATLLRSRYGARRVWVFGSLARGRVGPHSDVDLATEGMAAHELLRAHAEVCRLFPGTEVDLVVLEEASPVLRRRVEREGVPL